MCQVSGASESIGTPLPYRSVRLPYREGQTRTTHRTRPTEKPSKKDAKSTRHNIFLNSARCAAPFSLLEECERLLNLANSIPRCSEHRPPCQESAVITERRRYTNRNVSKRNGSATLPSPVRNRLPKSKYPANSAEGHNVLARYPTKRHQKTARKKQVALLFDCGGYDTQKNAMKMRQVGGRGTCGG